MISCALVWEKCEEKEEGALFSVFLFHFILNVK